MNDDSQDVLKFERVVVAYKCGRSFYNDSWISACESEPLCPQHGQTLIAESGEWISGFRPKTD